MTARAPRPPADLGESVRVLWRPLLRVFELSAGEVAMLAEACREWDACAALRVLAAAEAPVITGRLGQRMPSPVHVELRAHRRLFLAYMVALHVPLAEAEPGWLAGDAPADELAPRRRRGRG